MEAYATALTFAIPGFFVLIIIESLAARLMGMQINQGMDTVSSLSSGMTNTIKSILGLSIVIISYDWLVSHLAIFEIQSTVWLYVLAFIGIDFASYWAHRFNHEINVLWNRHIVHHSSEEFNLSCALRQTISDFVGVYFFLYIPIALIGIPTQIVGVMAPLHLFAQFWYHTRLIKRMGLLEHLIVTPAHHRVHHAINAEYLDKNYAAIFILWDKWFGTFQDELPDVPPVYGTKRPAGTWNPVLINFMHIWTLAQDAWRTRNWWDKLRLWFMPTGWRPADVQEKYPVSSVEDVYTREKYNPYTPMLMKLWAWFQLTINTFFLYYILLRFGDFPFVEIVLYCLFLFISIFSYTTLMDRHKLAIPMELLRTGLALGLIYQSGNWYGMDSFLFAGATAVFIAYLILSAGMTLYGTLIVSPESTLEQESQTLEVD